MSVADLPSAGPGQLGRPADLPTVAYHVVRLVDAGVLAEQLGAVPEGPPEHFYRLAA